MGGDRGRMAVAGGLAIAVGLIALIAVLASGGSGTEDLRVEIAAAGPTGAQVIVYVDDPKVNVPITAEGRRRVTLECLDEQRKVLVRAPHKWPFRDTDGGTYNPHIHENVSPGQANRIKRCRLRGTEGPLESQAAPAD